MRELAIGATGAPVRGVNHRAIAHLAPGRAVKLLPLAQSGRKIVDVVFVRIGEGDSKFILGCVDNRPLIEPELPSRFLGLCYNQVKCLDIQELISGHCILLDGRNLHGEVGALVVVADFQYMLRETRSAILPRLV